MPATNYPNGLTNRGTATASGLTAVTGSSTVTTPLDTISHVVCSAGQTPGTANNSAAFCYGTAHANATGAATFILRTLQSDCVTAGTAAFNVAWTAYGTLA